jgi:hypothetical protein
MWSSASLVNAEGPAEAALPALRDVTVAKSKHLRPPQERHRSTPRAFETTMPYLAERNLDPKPYRWRAKGADILAKIQRARQAMEGQAAASAPA